MHQPASQQDQYLEPNVREMEALDAAGMVLGHNGVVIVNGRTLLGFLCRLELLCWILAAAPSLLQQNQVCLG